MNTILKNKRFTLNLTIGKKLVGSFLTIALLLAVTGAISTYYLQTIDDEGTDLIERRTVILSNMLKIQIGVSKENSSLRGYMITKNSGFLDALKATDANVSNLISETNQISRIKEFQDTLLQFEAKHEEFKLKYDQLLQMVNDGQPDAKTNEFFVYQVIPLGSDLDSMVDKLANDQYQSMHEQSLKNTDIVDTAKLNVEVLSIIAVILAIVVGYAASRSISKPIMKIAGAAEKIASGDLTIAQIQVKNKDEIGSLSNSFNEMLENLRSLVKQISMSSEHVASSSQELTASSDQSSRASETIASSIQEVSQNAELQTRNVNEGVHAIHEISSGIRQISEGTHLTSSLSSETVQKALDGNDFLQTTIKQMDSAQATMNSLASAVLDMEKQSKEIKEIVVLISDIASQTNLLSLNAAIEAARAGEHGRGFAIVASEVQKLADQSIQAAGQIHQLVGGITSRTHHVVQTTELGVKEVSNGIEAVYTAGRLFEEIKGNVSEVSSQILDISAASQQISASAEQVVHSMDNISEGSIAVANQSTMVAASTQEQQASMEEISVSASSLSKMAMELRMAVEKFKV